MKLVWPYHRLHLHRDSYQWSPVPEGVWSAAGQRGLAGTTQASLGCRKAPPHLCGSLGWERVCKEGSTQDL